MSPEDFNKFYLEAMGPAKSWLARLRPELTRDPLTLEGFVADAFGLLYEGRNDVHLNPFGALLGKLRNVLAREKPRQVQSLVARDVDSDMGTEVARQIANPNSRTIASELGSREIRLKYSYQAVMGLPQDLQDLYDRVCMRYQSYKEIAAAYGTTENAIAQRWANIRRKLEESMARIDTDVAAPSKVPIRTREQALRAVDGLPNRMSELLCTVFVLRVPLEQVVLRLKFASKEEAQVILDEALSILAVRFRQPMPESLVNALANYPGKQP